ncbi:MAG TPA: exosortase family protein XrtF [Cyclobacteriaceae bacterium]|nr:exosortase family protein XrtF [Cyclobacteriaceae bacterium]
MSQLKQQLQEFKPTILFLIKFFGIYIIGNLLYGWYVTAWHPAPDPLTNWVTEQSAAGLRVFGYDAVAYEHHARPTTYITLNEKAVVAVYEGCNGLNVVVVFLAFLLAFGPYTRKLAWFIPLGLLVIHISNLLRIMLLFMVSLHMPNFLYFTHKYLFTAFIYLFVFLLWIWWVVRLAKPKQSNEPAA